MQYASPAAASAVVDQLDVVILGATEIDTDFNVNVHTDSNGIHHGRLRRPQRYRRGRKACR